MSAEIQRFSDEQLAQLREVLAEFFDPADEFVPPPSDEPISLGQEFPIRTWAEEIIFERRIKDGPARQEFLRTLPSRVLYPNAEITDREQAVLDYNRELLASRPPGFPANIKGFTVEIARSPSTGNEIGSVLVRPNFAPDRVDLSPTYIEQKVRRWLRDRLLEAQRADHNTEPRFG